MGKFLNSKCTRYNVFFHLWFHGFYWFCSRSQKGKGKTIVLDIMEAAEKLRRESFDDFETLTRVPATFECKKSDGSPVWYEIQTPHIESDYYGQVTSEEIHSFVWICDTQTFLGLKRYWSIFRPWKAPFILLRELNCTTTCTIKHVWCRQTCCFKFKCSWLKNYYSLKNRIFSHVGWILYKIVAVHWNPLFEGPLRIHNEDVPAYMKAYKAFARIISKKENQVWLGSRGRDKGITSWQ